MDRSELRRPVRQLTPGCNGIRGRLLLAMRLSSDTHDPPGTGGGLGRVEWPIRYGRVRCIQGRPTRSGPLWRRLAALRVAGLRPPPPVSPLSRRRAARSRRDAAARARPRALPPPQLAPALRPWAQGAQAGPGGGVAPIAVVGAVLLGGVAASRPRARPHGGGGSAPSSCFGATCGGGPARAGPPRRVPAHSTARPQASESCDRGEVSTRKLHVQTSAEVDAWFEALDHPLKQAMQRVRQVVLQADPRISETVKWQTPTFIYAGNIVSIRPRAKRFVSLMFHRGSEIPGRSPPPRRRRRPRAHDEVHRPRCGRGPRTGSRVRRARLVRGEGRRVATVSPAPPAAGVTAAECSGSSGTGSSGRTCAWRPRAGRSSRRTRTGRGRPRRRSGS